MRHQSVLRFGGTAAQVVAALYVLVGVTHFLMPRAQLRGAGGITDAFFRSLADSSAVFSLHYGVVALSSLLMMAVFLALLILLREHLGGALLWTGAVGLMGAALSAVDFAAVGVEAPRLAGAFMKAAPPAQVTMVIAGVPHADPCFLAMGLMSVFLLTVNAAALRHRLLPRALGYLGITGSILLFLVFTGSLVRVPLLIDAALALGGMMIGPVWYFWAGFALRRAGRPAEAAQREHDRKPRPAVRTA
jgi:hypothetical protein